MEYAFEKITTVEGYYALLASAQEKKLKLERRQRNLGESIDTFRKRLEKFSKEAADVQQTLVAFTKAYQSLPEGKHKLTMNIRIKRLEYRQVWLMIKARTYNTAALLAREVKYNKLAAQISVIAQYVISVQQNIAQVSKSVPAHAAQLLETGGLAVMGAEASVLSRIPISTLKMAPALFLPPEYLN